MSAQQFRGSLASGGTVVASGQGIEVYGPDGAQLAVFGREVISGVRRDSQVVTVERHNDTIVTFTAASITDAVGLEQFVRDVILAPLPPAEPPAEQAFEQPAPEPEAVDDTLPPPPPPLAFDTFDQEPEPEPGPPPRPPIVSRPEGEDDLPPPRDADLPPPTPTIAPPPSTLGQVEEEPEPIAPMPPPSSPPPPSYTTRPQAEGGPPATTAYAAPVIAEEDGGGRRWWIWGCLGCGGLLVLALICGGIALAAGWIDPDDLDDDDDPTPTPFIIIVTPTPADEATPTETPTEEDRVEATPTDPGNAATPTDGAGAATPTEDAGGAPTQAPPTGEILQPGETATVGAIEATYVGARIDTEGLIAPDAGREYLVLNFRMTNTSTEPVIMSSLLQFELLDVSGESFPVELFANLTTTLDAEIQPGDTLDGEIAFDVPAGGGPYTITYQDLFTQEQATWAVDEIAS